MKKNLKKTAIKALLALGALALLSSGCDSELAPEENYDILDPNKSNEGSLDLSGLEKILDVNDESFKLYTFYQADSASQREWRITSDKFLYITVKTIGLPEGYEVYIDNIHIDTTIKSRYAVMDGILQDSMDDRIHNAQMIGFPIDNNTEYYGINAVEGNNDTFIQGTIYGYSGYMGGSVDEKRRTEEDYRDLKVYANKFQVVYDLLIKAPGDEDFRNVSVATDFIVLTTYESLRQIEEEASRKLTPNN